MARMTEQQRAAALEEMIDDYARGNAELTGRSYEEAYAKFLETELGRGISAEIYALTSDSERGRTEPRAARTADATLDGTLAKAQSIEADIDAMARARAERTGEDHAAAYSAVLGSPEGRRLYAESSAIRSRIR